jgi:hypothetical protein
VDNGGADQFLFPAFTNIDSLRIFGVQPATDPCFNCTTFTLDDFEYGPATAPVPEPSTLALVGAGALAGLRRLRRRR